MHADAPLSTMARAGHRDVDRARALVDEAPPVGGTAMAEHGGRPVRENGGEQATVAGEPGTSDCVDAVVDGVEPAVGDAVRHVVSRDAELVQLLSRHEAVLAAGDAEDRVIGAFGHGVAAVRSCGGGLSAATRGVVAVRSCGGGLSAGTHATVAENVCRVGDGAELLRDGRRDPATIGRVGMRTRTFILALGAFFVLVAAVVSGCGSSVPGSSVAVVAGNPISLKAFNHWEYVAAKSQAAESPGQPVIVPNDPPKFTSCIAQAREQLPQLKKLKDSQLRSDCQQLFTSLSSETLDFLIKAYWYQADAHRLGIKLTDAQVQTALNTAVKSQFHTTSAYQSYLKETGQTQADLLYKFRVNQVFTKLSAKQTPQITPAAIATYYANHRSQFGTPERRNMRIVLATTAANAAAARKALQSGRSWQVVAKKYSTDPTTKNTGGVLTDVTSGQQDAALSRAAFAATVGKLVGPVKGQFGYYVLEVTKITPGTQRSLAQSTALIKQTLTSENQQAAETAVDNDARKNWQSKTTCRGVYKMGDCKGYKAPKTATTATPGAGGTATSP